MFSTRTIRTKRPGRFIVSRSLGPIPLLIGLGSVVILGDVLLFFIWEFPSASQVGSGNVLTSVNDRWKRLIGNGQHPPPLTQQHSSHTRGATSAYPALEQIDMKSRETVAEMLRQTGAIVPVNIISKLPTLEQVSELYGPSPVILGLDRCPHFRDSVPAIRRMLGAAGMFSTGTNLVTHLLKRNCYIPERLQAFGSPHDGLLLDEDKLTVSKEQLGMRWQVPWGKHTPAVYKERHTTEKAGGINRDDILPIVSIRNPWRWMQSMCKNPYTAKWPHYRVCPHLTMVDESISSEPMSSDFTQNPGTDIEWNPVTVKYGAGVENYTSLVHLWLDWYHQYVFDATYPRLIIRMEDLVFHTRETIQEICHCAGGVLYPGFKFVTESAKKDSPGHDTSTGLTEAWIKYSQPLAPKAGLVPSDFYAALYALKHDPDKMMTLFGYHHPPPD